MKLEFIKAVMASLPNINADQIKYWECKTMRSDDVIRGINFANRNGYDTLIYNNVVPNKETFIKKWSVKILDKDDLIKIAFETDNFELLNFLN